MIPPLKVLFMAAEADPLVKIGGLGDVAGSLPPALRSPSPRPSDQDGVDVRVVIPAHGGIDRQAYGFKPVAAMTVYHARGPMLAEALAAEVNGVPFYLIAGPLIPEDSPVYTADAGLDGPKFAFFSLAAMEMTRALDWSPDILHANDWHTAAAVYWLSLNRDQDAFFQETASILEVHNLPYLGVGAEAAMQAFGLPTSQDVTLPEWARQTPLPLGLLTADHIVTVSPGYAREILTPEFGSGLHDFLQGRASAISGILNGLDVEIWNPATDSHLPAQYTVASLPYRARNKASLQMEFDLPEDRDNPLLAMVTRMDHQKGVDLALEALERIGDLRWQAILLGTGDPELEAAAYGLEMRYPQRVRAAIRFDTALSRRIYSGADCLLIPSRYEPCGLAQMIAMRYGCVPIARATGGLQDTISDYHQSRDSTGFLFQETSPVALEAALRRALDVYRDKRRWQGLQRRGMRQDFSWERSASEYFKLYRSLVKSRSASDTMGEERKDV